MERKLFVYSSNKIVEMGNIIDMYCWHYDYKARSKS